jgi:RNA polymerase sigma factor (sigma-70 family)
MVRAMIHHDLSEPSGYGSGDVSTSDRLLARMKNGDQDAWVEFVRFYEPRLLARIRGKIRRHDDAEAICQEVTLSVFRKVRDFVRRHTGAFRAYLWATAESKISDYFRKRRPEAAGVGPDGPMEVEDDRRCADGTANSDDAGEKYARLLEMIRAYFGDATCAIIDRTVVHGERVADVAAALGLSESAAKSRKCRALQFLRDRPELLP